jgi:hypothetical protein
MPELGQIRLQRHSICGVAAVLSDQALRIGRSLSASRQPPLIIPQAGGDFRDKSSGWPGSAPCPTGMEFLCDEA